MGKYTYREQYGIVVICESEEEQQLIYKKLSKLGLNLKVVVV